MPAAASAEHFDKFQHLNEDLHRKHITNRPGNHPKQVKEKEPLLLTSDNVSNEILLEFMGCSRKRKFETDVVAETNRKLIDPSLSVYKCRFCEFYHLGHGNGGLPEHYALANARKAWKKYPDKANEIVRKYNLLLCCRVP